MASESELSQTLPDESIIEQTLRAIVQDKRDDATLSVKKVRTAAEEQLGLDANFFKTDEKWKAKSQEIINDAFNEPEREPSPPQAKTSQKQAKAKKPTETKPKETKPAKKRASTEAAVKSTKRQRRAAASESELSDAPSDFGSEDTDMKARTTAKSKISGPPARGRGRKQAVVDSDSDNELSDASAKENRPALKSQEEAELVKTSEKPQDDSESELSDVLDEPAPAKSKRQKSASADGKGSKGSKAKKASAPGKEVTPDEAEIKRLQGWLVKCGIRKLWHRELAAYDNPKAKIRHLKDMLKDAGMDGRYSVEKARAIKEQRELAADLEAVTEGAKIWGHEGDDKDEEESEAQDKPKRRAAAASRFIDFGDSGDEED